jgi:hypothetical protein
VSDDVRKTASVARKRVSINKLNPKKYRRNPRDREKPWGGTGERRTREAERADFICREEKRTRISGGPARVT